MTPCPKVGNRPYFTCIKYPVLLVRVASRYVCHWGRKRKKIPMTGKGNSVFLSMYLIWQKGEEEIVKYSTNIDLCLLVSLLHTLSDAHAGRVRRPAANLGYFTTSAVS